MLIEIVLFASKIFKKLGDFQISQTLLPVASIKVIKFALYCSPYKIPKQFKKKKDKGKEWTSLMLTRTTTSR